MSTTQRRQVRCFCPHTCGPSGPKVNSNVAKAHTEKTLRLQSRSSVPSVHHAQSVASTSAALPSPGGDTPTLDLATAQDDRSLTSGGDFSLGPNAAEIRAMSQTDTDRPLSAGLPSYSRTGSPLLQGAPQAAPVARSDEWLIDCGEVPIAPSDLLHLVDNFELINTASAANAIPLTQRTATTPPQPSELERRMTRAYRRALEDAEQQARKRPASPSDGTSGRDEELADVDGGFEEQNDQLDDPDPVFPLEEDDSDDPFYDPTPASHSPQPNLDPVLLMIYTVVAWLHEQWHLPRAACHVLLHVFSLLFMLLGYPDLQRQTFVTLKSVRRALGTDVIVQLLPVCPSCRDVFPALNAPDRCPHCDEALFRTASRNGKRTVTDTPIIKYPFCPISAQLSSILNQPGVEDACDSWRKRARVPGEYRDVFDGRIARELKAHDGSLFWRNESDCLHGPDGELRLGVMWGLDWFSHIVSNTAPSHSSCPTSFSIANLPVSHRFRTSNLLCTSILPGPKEQSGDEVQRFIRPIINDLLRLWKDGILIPTVSRPEGRRVRVILLALVCDKPAAHKVAGFGSHSHRFFCHCCWCKSDDMATTHSFKRNGCAPRTNAEQRRLGEQYRCLETKSQRDAFVKEHATRYTQLSRLPYFDLVRQVVIDPMHNLALGLVKTQFYHIWVQSGILSDAKLRMLHDLIAECDVPDYLGRLPKEIGVPAGGSLTADQWIILATVMGPLTVPQLWEEVLSGSADLPDRLAAIARFEEKRRAALTAHAEERARLQAEKLVEKERLAEARRAAANAARAGEPSVGVGMDPAPNAPATSKAKRPARPKVVPDAPFNMHRDDPAHFQKLSTALHILLRHSLTDTRIDLAEGLLRGYCAGIVSLYGSSAVRPNHHYATHVAEYARDFGPLSGFWTFLFERLNRVLKGYNTNNHGNGDIETTFFTEFLRTCSTSRLVYRLLNTPEGSFTNLSARQMLKATHEERGTVAGLAQLASDLENEDAHELSFQLSSAYQIRDLSHALYHTVLHHLSIIQPQLSLYSPLTTPPTPHSIPMSALATFYPHVVIRNRRYHASSSSGNVSKALVSAAVRSDNSCSTRVCEILDILAFQQPGTALVFLWAHVRWFVPYRAGIVSSAWQSSEHLSRRLWLQDVYDDGPSAPPRLIDVSSILYHVARVPVLVDDEQLWATIGIDKD